jgi:hypothetical protein
MEIRRFVASYFLFLFCCFVLLLASSCIHCVVVNFIVTVKVSGNLLLDGEELPIDSV